MSFARSIGITSGDGSIDPFVTAQIGLPDSGQMITIEGNITPVGGAILPISGSPLTSPAIPASGQTYWIIQLSTVTGAASVKSSTAAMPTADPSNTIIFQDTLLPTDPSIAQGGGAETVDQV